MWTIDIAYSHTTIVTVTTYMLARLLQGCHHIVTIMLQPCNNLGNIIKWIKARPARPKI